GGRPGELPDRDRAAREPARLLCGDVVHPEVRHPEALAEDIELAVGLFAVLVGVGPGIGRREGKRLAVGRPGETPDAVLGGGDLARLAAARIDAVDLPLLVALPRKGDLRPLSRP